MNTSTIPGRQINVPTSNEEVKGEYLCAQGVRDVAAIRSCVCHSKLPNGQTTSGHYINLQGWEGQLLTVRIPLLSYEPS